MIRRTLIPIIKLSLNFLQKSGDITILQLLLLHIISILSLKLVDEYLIECYHITVIPTFLVLVYGLLKMQNIKSS